MIFLTPDIIIINKKASLRKDTIYKEGGGHSNTLMLQSYAKIRIEKHPMSYKKGNIR
jgi:hypothetical protein